MPCGWNVCGFTQMWCVCPRPAGTDDHRLGGSSEHRCVTFGVRNLKSISWGQKQGVGGCVPPGAQGRLGLCLFSFWRRLHSLAHRPPSIVKPVESASPSQAALAPSWLGELSAQGVGGLGGALILRAGTAGHTCRASGSRCCRTDILEPVTWLH